MRRNVCQRMPSGSWAPEKTRFFRSYPRARRVRGDTDVHDLAAFEGDNNECVEGLEVRGEHREESQAQTCEAWFRRKVLQDGPRQRARCFGRYFATVRGDTRQPSFASSPAIRFSPHRRFSRQIRRMRALNSASIGGRPTRRRRIFRGLCFRASRSRRGIAENRSAFAPLG